MREKKVTIYPTIYRTHEAKVTSLDTVLTRIKEGKSEHRIHKIREGDKSEKQYALVVCLKMVRGRMICLSITVD